MTVFRHRRLRTHFGALESVTLAMCCMRGPPVRGMLGLGGARVGPPGFGGRPLLFLTGSWVPPVLRDTDGCVWNATGTLALSAVLADA